MNFMLAISDNFVELAADPQTSGKAFAAVEAAGANAVRFPMRWDLIEADDGGRDWRPYEPLSRYLSLTGLSAVPEIYGCPTRWIQEGEAVLEDGGGAYPAGERALNAYADFVVETVDFFSRHGGTVGAVEIWPEPNVPGISEVADPTAFRRLVATALLYITSANQTGQFRSAVLPISGGVRVGDSASWRAHLEAALEQDYQCAIGVRPAPVRSAADGDDARRLGGEVSDAVAEALGATDNAAWVTEINISRGGPSGESGQAEAAKETLAAAASIDRLGGLAIGPLTDKAQDPAGSSSLLRSDLSGTPAIDAIAESDLAQRGIE